MIEKNYNVRETAKILGITVRTVRQWIHNGKLNAKKYIGGKGWYISHNEIERVQKEMR